MITAAVSGMLLAANKNTLRRFQVDSPLTEEAREVVFKFSNLRELSVVFEKGASPSPAVLPNLTELIIEHSNDWDWLQIFRGATFGKLGVVTFDSRYESISDFLEEFKRVALSASIQDTLSEFQLLTFCSWNPQYSSLLPYTKLTSLVVQFSCDDGCSSSVDDDVITDLARAMPGLETLQLGGIPCDWIVTGVTVKGLVALADHCPDLSGLCVHLQVATLGAASATVGMTSSNTEAPPLRRGSAFRILIVGDMPVPEESVPVVAQTLLHLFPRIAYIDYVDQSWKKVMGAISSSREPIVDSFGKEHPPCPSE